MTYRELARKRPHLQMLIEYLTCRQCEQRQPCAYDFGTDSWFCSEECCQQWYLLHPATRGQHA